MKRAALVGCAVCCVGALAAFQRPFREFSGIEYSLGSIPLPPDHRENSEWTFARLMFPPGPLNGYAGRDLDWHTGYSLWSQDFPRADRHFSLAVRRLTRLHVRSVEQPVNLDEGDQYDWPWLYGVEGGHWALTDAQVKAFREYLLRGGFFMCDDFHGTQAWQVFEEGIKRVFPDRQIGEIDDADAIFHTIYDLDERYQVPGAQYIYSRRLWEKDG